MRRAATLGALALALVTLAACSPVPAPRELVFARTSYKRAKERGADVPVELDEARRALAAAEHRFEEVGAEPEVVGLAYAADRKAQRVESLARRAELERELARLGQAARQLEVDRDARARKAEADARDEAERRARDADSAARIRREAEERVSRSMDALKRIASSVRSEPRGLVLTFAQGALFAQEVTALSAPARGKLDELAAALQRDKPGAKIVVEAHTDNQRSLAHSTGIAKAQADAVAAHLAKKGIANVRAEGIGAQRPLGSNASPDGRATNRRVEIIVEP